MGHKTVENMAETLSLLLYDKLRVKGDGLQAKITRAGRLLPRRIRQKATLIAEAERFAGNPKLARMIDETALNRAYKEVETHLNSIDVADLRKGRLINFFGLLSFNLLVVGALLLGFLVWKGFL